MKDMKLLLAGAIVAVRLQMLTGEWHTRNHNAGNTHLEPVAGEYFKPCTRGAASVRSSVALAFYRPIPGCLKRRGQQL